MSFPPVAVPLVKRGKRERHRAGSVRGPAAAGDGRAMNRSTVREFVAPESRLPPGEVLVPTEVGDPVRGPLPSPAAPLVGGTLRRKGTRVSFAPAGPCLDPGADGGAALFVATCQRRDGSTAAVAAAASPADRVAVAAARSAVEEWSAVIATRRLLAAASPWCSGAMQALAAARRAAAGRRTVHVYGEMAGDPEAIADLAAQGAVFVGSLDEVPDGASVVFPAHGVPADVRARAAARGLEIIDATCPLVSGVHAEARRFAERGDDILLIGQPGHRAVASIAGQAPARTALVSSPAGTATLQVTDSRRVSYLVQPGIPVEEAMSVAAALRSRFPALHGPNPDGFCYAASDRAEAIRTIASACDTMLVLGAADSPDSRYLQRLASGGGARAHIVAQAGDIVPAMLSGASAIGLAESTSAGPSLAGEVTEALSGLGPLSVTSRRVITEVVGAPAAPAPAATPPAPAPAATPPAPATPA
jgi:4-hydroxy-3-methylbut-2-en-1-yl diphosphate reductase